MEVLLPVLGWIGFDPTNDLIAGERHLRVAIGRDYGDVPPTRGVFMGNADSSLDVSVHVRRAEDPELEEPLAMSVDLAQAQTGVPLASAMDMAQQQQQQQ